MAVSPSAPSFVAVRGGPLPPEQTLEVQSSTDVPIKGVNVGVEDGNPPDVMWSVRVSNNAMPTAIYVQPLSTDAPAGTYRLRLHVASDRAANGPVIVDVVYRLAEQ